MIIPARIVARDADGDLWQTTIERSGHEISLHVAAHPTIPSRYTIDQRTTFDAWEESVVAALALIDAGAAEKIVLAREVVIEADAPFDVRAVLETLHATQPGCVVYADGGFVGASPELLVRRTGSAVLARPMAGTGLDAAELVRSEKDAREHGFVVDAVCEALTPACTDVTATGPAPVELADVTHLATTITAQLRDSEISAVDLALALHPTPAVAGTPRAAALKAIGQLEPSPRPLRGSVRLGGRPRRRRIRRRATRRADRRAACSPACRSRHRGRIEPGIRMGRDPGQARADAARARTRLTARGGGLIVVEDRSVDRARAENTHAHGRVHDVAVALLDHERVSGNHAVPCPTSSVPIANPMPDAPPVMIATRPRNDPRRRLTWSRRLHAQPRPRGHGGARHSSHGRSEPRSRGAHRTRRRQRPV